MRVRLFSALLIGVLAAAGLAVTAADAQEGACFRLWVARNSIYKANGYCFKTDRAIAYFGNEGCAYEYEGDVPMSRADRARIARIRAQERNLGCR